MDIRHAIAGELPRVRRYARALLSGDIHRADDLVQQSLERALEKLHLFRRDSNLRAWLLSIVHNVHLNNHRREKNRPTDAWDEALDDTVAATENSEHGVIIRDIERALAALSLDQREVVVLVGLEGMDYKEVSEILDIPMGTVMSRLSRGRERLRILMEGDTRHAPALRRIK
ncbi:sigma-70 family RNA polymerase sigma factor [Varunaivibrio sulfuroxidans]|uniref:RNA polymerase sigma-70 factor (ECF subfamily) n=1 Tax=Varunaivibrio sulfuroxidans TaxID=1773489 RepID=A0A4R3JDW4_9PROT|nr:sigma-70 family RNA polymerase sigma factor [Varunaivibrio sulfuroxidans]TCS63615.1 RNA polymerase sigma-70 factor (ECF subfamily) [Varunaivibrio sulfuroxidans]WES30243.1 sigma-70 family RNA polymerase sigma factor [Varunaivibrio sulfuroxidans]